MTTSIAAVLPRREPPGPAPGVSSLLVLGGYAADGEPAGALYFWAHSRFPGDFEVGLHSHERLEILTLVLDGIMSHYDTATRRWTDLHPGDAQLIRSGPGISHNERFITGMRGYQIQFDPGQDMARRQEPSYTNYPVSSFSAHLVGGALVTDLVGRNGPIDARTEGLSVRRIAVPAGASAALEVGAGQFTLAHLIEGAAAINGASAEAGDAISLDDASSLSVAATAPADLFVVSVPARPSYEPQRRRFGAGEQARAPFPGASGDPGPSKN
jgi:quercetin 2,3-dioxygenase